MTGKFQHKKSLGQHFLNSDYVPKQMCDAGRCAPGDIIVEIGPGTGVLTREILARGASVIAIEADQRAIASLASTFTEEIASKHLTILHRDARTLDLHRLGVKAGQYKVIANIPYYISGLLFRLFLDSDCQPSDLVFLVQKELGERIARDSKSSLLSLSVQAFGNAHYVNTIKRGHFSPPPNVDSAIISVANISNDYFQSFDKVLFFNIIKAGFAQKRKQLAPNLKALFPVEATKAALTVLNHSPTSRAEDLNLSDWSQLITHLQSTA